MIFWAENNFLKISVDSKGAELVSLFSKRFKKEFLWNGDPLFWPRHSPILFPIVGKLKSDRYRIDNSFYTLKQHGFARDLLFSVDETNNTRLSFVLEENEETLKMYPFRYSLKIVYEINGNELSIEAKIKNKENKKMPFSLGFHPAFICPFKEEETIDEYCILFEKEEKCWRLYLEKGLIARKEIVWLKDGFLPLSEKLFSEDAVIFDKPSSEKVVLQKRDFKSPKIEVNFKGFRNLGLWKKKDAPFVCIEPWNGLPDYKESDQEFFKKDGIVILKEDGTSYYKIKIRLWE